MRSRSPRPASTRRLIRPPSRTRTWSSPSVGQRAPGGTTVTANTQGVASFDGLVISTTLPTPSPRRVPTGYAADGLTAQERHCRQRWRLQRQPVRRRDGCLQQHAADRRDGSRSTRRSRVARTRRSSATSTAKQIHLLTISTQADATGDGTLTATGVLAGYLHLHDRRRSVSRTRIDRILREPGSGRALAICQRARARGQLVVLQLEKMLYFVPCGPYVRLTNS